MITDKLNDKIPLPGGVNWRSVRTALVVSILTASLWWSWDWVKAVNALPEQVQQNTEAIEKMNPKLDKILDLIQKTVERQMTVTGQVRVVADGGRDDATLWINMASPASVYDGMRKVRVTNLGDPSRRDRDLLIGGRINAPGSIIGEICENAARLLNADGNEAVHVKIQPLEEP